MQVITFATAEPAMMLFMTRITAIPALCPSMPLFCKQQTQILKDLVWTVIALNVT